MPNGEAAAKSITSVAGFGTSRYREVMAGWIPPRLRLLLGADLDEVTPESLYATGWVAGRSRSGVQASALR